MEGIHDWIFTLGSLVLCVSLIPSLLSSNKPSWKTSIMTAAVLYIFAGNYYHMGLYKSATMMFISGVLWTILLFQVILNKHSFKSRIKTLRTSFWFKNNLSNKN